MAGREDDASVRIEIESSALTPSFLPGAERRLPSSRSRGGPSSRVVIVVGVVIAILSVVTILVVRPKAGETADGQQRQAPTTAAPEPIQRSTLEGQGAESLAVIRGGVHISDLPGSVLNVVPWGDGYLALTATNDGQPIPSLFESADGRTWTRLDTKIGTAGSGDEGVFGNPTEARPHVTWGALGNAGDGRLGLSQIQTTFGESQTIRAERTTITRLYSEDGGIWAPDPQFDVMDIEDAYVVPVVNNMDLTAVAVYLGGGNPLIEQIVNDHVSDPVARDRCWLRAIADGGEGTGTLVRLLPCDFGTSLALTTAMLHNPEVANDIGLCLEQLNSRSGPPIDIFSQRRNEPTIYRYLAQGTLGALPVGTPSGNLAILDPGKSLSAAPACAALSEQSPLAPIEPGVVLLEPGGGSIRMTSGQTIPPVAMFELKSTLVATNDAVLVPAGNQMFAVDLVSGAWTSVASSMDDNELVWASSNGDLVFTFDGAEMHVAAVGEEWIVVELDRPIDPVRLLFADEQRVIVTDQVGAVLAIDLPAIE